ncbi:MAG: hypothetical protein IJS88_03340 [Alphaproteobacteria bacterium]|nr:hypothetical protein [Alphaproteobacteria bacterium]
MKQKSLFESFIGLFIRTKSKSDNNIPAGKAIDLQNAYITATQCADYSTESPYTEIIKQLYSSEPEIISSALYYLQKIAQNETEIAPKIISALDSCISAKSGISASTKEHIKHTIDIINKYQPK